MPIRVVLRCSLVMLVVVMSQPALGVHMLGCLVVGGIGYFNKSDEDEF